jgi:putative ABC transport system ATP-binding protein
MKAELSTGQSTPALPLREQRWFHPAPALIRVRAATKDYGGTAAERALDGVDLDVRRGSLVAVVGKSGSGKSTLLNLITGIDRPTAGEIYVADVAVHSLDEEARAVWRGRNVGIVFQFFQLLPTLSVIENVMLPMDFCERWPAGERRDRAQALLGRVDLGRHADKLPAALSGGQQQRAAIARALANDPALIVADEPTGNLDSRTAADVMALLAGLATAGKTVVIVTHEREIANVVDQVVALRDGRVETVSAGGRRRQANGGGS